MDYSYTAWFVASSGVVDTYYSYINVTYSYGHGNSFALRARVGTMMFIMSILLVTSTTVAIVFAVPTDSPDTGWDTSACLVYQSGAVDHSNYYGVTSSYGSPYTGWMQYSLANLLSPEGELILTDGSMSVFDSYGKTFSGHDLSKFFTYR